ncbi:hypothetical protein [Methylobacterium sp. 1973]|uniref:hypothetical protein n=1 Tax=Methylobacterium sp. 1973 TaxID=3156421 RepID=UPI00339B6FFD
MATDPALTAAIGELADAVLYAAGGLAAVILVMGAVVTVVASGVLHQLQDLNDQVTKIRDEGVDINVEAGAIGRSPLDAEQVVRGAGFLITLWRKVLAKPGEAIPTTERLTLDLGEAMGVALPTRQGVVAIVPGGKKIRSGLMPYGAAPTPAALAPESA